MAAARLADEVEPRPAEMLLQPAERCVDQRHFARAAAVEMIAGGAEDAGPCEMKVGAAESGGELLGQRLHVVGRGRQVKVVGGESGFAQLDGIAAQEDHRIGARAFGTGAIEGEHIAQAVDVDPDAARTVALRRIGRDAFHDIIAGKGRRRTIGQVGVADHGRAYHLGRKQESHPMGRPAGKSIRPRSPAG